METGNRESNRQDPISVCLGVALCAIGGAGGIVGSMGTIGWRSTRIG